MSRTRLIKPAFFKHGELFAAEIETGLPLRIAFAGLWTVTDKACRFRWTRDLKPDVLPYDDVDMLEVLESLEHHGFVRSYVVDGKRYGLIPSFGQHQTFHKTERHSTLPPPPIDGESTVGPPLNNGESPVRYMAVTGTVAGTGTGTGTVKDPTPTTAASATDEAALAAMLESDADRTALTGVLIRSRSRVAALTALCSILTSQDPAVQPAPTASVFGAALRDLAANGEVFSAARFRGYIRRVAQPPTNGRRPHGNGKNPGFDKIGGDE